MEKVSAGFSVDVGRLAAAGLTELRESLTAELIAREKLTAEERLYLDLADSSQFNSALFPAKQRVATQGQMPPNAFLVVAGQLLGVAGDKVYRLGPGSVLGLAESLAGRPMPYTVITVSEVKAKIIPVHKIATIIGTLPGPMQKILQTLYRRALHEPAPPDVR